MSTGDFTFFPDVTSGLAAVDELDTNAPPIGIGELEDADEVRQLFFGAVGEVYRRVDILNPDGSIFLHDAPVLEGNVSVDYERAERRMLDIVLDNEDGSLRSDPTGFWYDKIIKVYRGVQNVNGDARYYPIGTFLIDTISEPHFPPTVSVSARDFTKKMMLGKFSEATAYTAGTAIETVIHALAANSDVFDRNIPATGARLSRDFFWEAGTSRWDAAFELAEAHGYELYFDASGVLVMRLFVDPTTAPIAFRFNTGADGNLASYEYSTNDSRIFNHILVKGKSGNTSTDLPVAGSAENTNPLSPTRIRQPGESGGLERRTYVYDSDLVTTEAQAQALALSMLRVMALESYEVTMDALVAPWLEAGVAVEFIDPDPSLLAPTRFLLTSFSIPLDLAVMSASGRRVTIVE